MEQRGRRAHSNRVLPLASFALSRSTRPELPSRSRFDIEWRVTFQAGCVRNTALVQVPPEPEDTSCIRRPSRWQACHTVTTILPTGVHRTQVSAVSPGCDVRPRNHRAPRWHTGSPGEPSYHQGAICHVTHSSNHFRAPQAGVGIIGDAWKLIRDFEVQVDGLLDLSDLAATRLAPARRWSLKAL